MDPDYRCAMSAFAVIGARKTNVLETAVPHNWWFDYRKNGIDLMNIALGVDQVHVDRFHVLHNNIGDVLAVMDKVKVLNSK